MFKMTRTKMHYFLAPKEISLMWLIFYSKRMLTSQWPIKMGATPYTLLPAMAIMK
jgi:hypothetical protein